MTATTNDREFRLRRSLKRLGYDLVDADAGAFYIRHQGSMLTDPLPPSVKYRIVI